MARSATSSSPPPTSPGRTVMTETGSGEGARRVSRRVLVAIAATAAFAAAAVTALLVNIIERKQEAKNPFFRVVELDDATDDPAVWGKNFPLQYDAYRR